jgi:hypothetical protein
MAISAAYPSAGSSISMVAVPAMDMAPQKLGVGHSEDGTSRYWLQLLPEVRRMIAPWSQLNMKRCVVPGALAEVKGSTYTAHERQQRQASMQHTKLT